jgi:myo-inositol-1(or 4)-monophosphatase
MSDFIEIAVRAAREAGSLLMEKQKSQFSIEKKGAVDLVTDADRASEALIRDIIFDKFPGHSFQAEEGTVSTQKSPYLWLVDPLDGTTNYAHRFPVWCVSICLLESENPIAGCVYNPNLDECFTAERGGGAFLNGNRISVSKTDRLSDSLLATGFPYDIRESNINNLKEFSAFALSAQAIRRAGSAAMDLAYVACGRFDGFWEMKLHPWDIAAGSLLVQEASGLITSWSGSKFEIGSGEVLSSNGLIHAEMLNVLKGVRGL